MFKAFALGARARSQIMETVGTNNAASTNAGRIVQPISSRVLPCV